MSTLKAKQFHFIDDIDIAASTLTVIGRIEEFATRAGNVAHTWVRRSNERRALAQMNEHMLADIGLTRFDVRQEVDKYFWQK
jgi:uncharacterized protein YjiS (DUF1127 family)